MVGLIMISCSLKRILSYFAVSILLVLQISCNGGGANGSDSSTKVATLKTIEINPPKASIAVGATLEFTATGIYSDDSKHVITEEVTWKSSDEALVTISSSGLATANKKVKGDVKITATFKGISSNVPLSVTEAVIKSIDVSPKGAQITVSKQQNFKANATYSDGSTLDVTNQVIWKSSKENVAVISDNVATGLSIGSTEISATLNDVVGVTNLNVSNAKLKSIEVTPVSTSIPKGDTQQFIATGIYDDETRSPLNEVTWKSSKEDVATISSSGVASGLKSGGTTYITANVDSITSNQASLTVNDAELKSIEITPKGNVQMPNGTTKQFTATGIYSDSSERIITEEVTWNSSSSDIVAISNAKNTYGLATALLEGDTNITATFSGSKAKSNVVALHVNKALLQSIKVTASAYLIPKDSTQQFKAMGSYSDGKDYDITQNVTWYSSNTTIASISNTAGSKGLANGLSAGDSNITAEFDQIKSIAVKLTVTDVKLKSIEITPESAEIAMGENKQFIATGVYSDDSKRTITEEVTWKSSNETTASISNAKGTYGLAKALNKGSSDITAIFKGVTSNTAKLGVTEAKLISINLTPSSGKMPKGTTLQFKADGVYSDGASREITEEVTWKSSNETIASINKEGLATALLEGDTNITANIKQITSDATKLSVTKAELRSIKVTPESPVVTRGANQQFKAIAKYSDDTSLDVTTKATWKSSNETVATIDASGIATGKILGNTNITSEMDGFISQAVTLSVSDEILESITIKSPTPLMIQGKTSTLIALGSYKDGRTGVDITNKVTWKSSADDIVTIDDKAVVTAKKPGTSSISASLGDIKSPKSDIKVGLLIFVSRDTHDGKFAFVADPVDQGYRNADKFCTEQAESVGYPSGEYKFMISEHNSISKGLTYINIEGKRIVDKANNEQTLIDQAEYEDLENRISLQDVQIWTGSKLRSDPKSSNCNYWRMNTTVTYAGSVDHPATGSGSAWWWDLDLSTHTKCVTQNHLYCVQQPN